jgi:hypothetical protein
MPVSELGERIAALSASFEAEKEYQHERWHKLDNDLTPVVNLPEKLTREIGRLQGIFDGKISTVTREIERSITAAVEKAIEPLNVEVIDLKTRVSALETAQVADKTAKGVLVWFLQSPLIGWLFAVGVILWTKLGAKP